MAIDQSQKIAVEAILRMVVAENYSNESQDTAEQQLGHILNHSKEGRAVLPQLLDALQRNQGKRAFKLIARRSGRLTSMERVILAMVIGSVLALTSASLGLILIPQSARIAVPLLCEPEVETTLVVASEVEQIDNTPYLCPSSTVSMSVPSVVATLFVVYWMPFALLGYLFMLFAIRPVSLQ